MVPNAEQIDSAERRQLRARYERLVRRILQRVQDADEVSSREIIAAGRSVERIVDQARECVDSVQSLVGDQIGRIDEYQADTRETIQSHEDAVGRALEKSNEVSAIGTRISDFAFQAQLLALNARIEASRAENGAAFAVIAQEMGALSEAISKSNESVTASVNEMVASLTELQKHADSIRDASVSFSDGLTAINERSRTTFADASGDSGLMHEIVRTAYETLSHLQFQDPMVQELRQIGKLLQDFADGLDHPAASDPETDPAQEENSPEAGEVILF